MAAKEGKQVHLIQPTLNQQYQPKPASKKVAMRRKGIYQEKGYVNVIVTSVHTEIQVLERAYKSRWSQTGLLDLKNKHL